MSQPHLQPWPWLSLSIEDDMLARQHQSPPYQVPATAAEFLIGRSRTYISEPSLVHYRSQSRD
jgi:hypothetical protein